MFPSVTLHSIYLTDKTRLSNEFTARHHPAAIVHPIGGMVDLGS